MDRSSSRRRLALLAVSFLLLAACSSGDDDGGVDSSPSTTAATDTDTDTDTDSGSGDGDADEGSAGALERYADYQSINYDDPDHWVCRPDRTDICDEDLSSTTVEADGTLTVEPFEIAEDAPVDCFYVYPTISQDPTQFSDWEASDLEEGWVTVNQAARLQSTCRVFAPVYRQRTLAGLAAGIGGGEAPDGGETVDPFDDVLDAFRTYMAQDNQGRGVVLIGHSQGAAMLNQLIAEEIDGNDDVREKLVSAYLVGWNMSVPEGEDVGGDFENVSLCRTPDQTGCAASWVTFRATAPPAEGAFFGGPRSGSGRDVDTTAESGLVAACTNPAALEGGPAGVDAYFPVSGGSILTAGAPDDGSFWVDGGGIETPFVSVPGLIDARCAESDGFNYLAVTVNGDPADPRADDIPGDLSPEWGLHLVDLNVMMGDVVALVTQQAEAWLS